MGTLRVIWLLGYQGLWQVALQLFASMPIVAARPHIITYNAVVSTAATKWDVALQLSSMVSRIRRKPLFLFFFKGWGFLI